MCAVSKRAGRSSSRRRRKFPATVTSTPPAAWRPRSSRTRPTRAQRHRRRLPARHEGASRLAATRTRARSSSSATKVTKRWSGRWARRPMQSRPRADGRGGGEALDVPAAAKLAYVTQTTLSVDEPGGNHHRAAPALPGDPRARKEDICYATSNRQWAVKEMLPEIDLLLVIGSRNSSNSNRLVETSRRRHPGAPHRRRDGDRRGVARRSTNRRDHVRRVGAEKLVNPSLRLVPSTRRDGHRGVPARRGRRDVPSSRRAPPRARAGFQG